jgi:uncharacterized protein (TIGR03435 family)
MPIRFGLTLLAATLVAPGFAAGQSSAAAPPSSPGLAFDVASVRPAAPIDQAAMLAGLRAGRRPESVHIDGLRATFTYMSLKDLIAYGYKVRAYQISGPEWITTDRFDIAAKLPEGASRDDVPAMLEALLIERFKLAAHLETKEHPVMALVVAKSGAKLQESTANPEPFDETAPLKPGETKIDSIDGPIRLSRNPDGSTTYAMGARGSFTLKIDGQNGSMHMTGSGMSMKGLAYMLNSLAGGSSRPVVDMTGLTGHYELGVDFSLADLVAGLRDKGIDIPTGPPSANSGPSDPGSDSTVTDALAKLGLRLEKSKAPIEQLLIDHVEKTATEN